MRTPQAHQAANDERLKTVLGFIQDEISNEITVAPGWVVNIRHKLQDMGYHLDSFTGVYGGLRGDWVTICWEEK